MALTLSSLISTQTKAEILTKGLQVAQSVGLTVTSWAVGDPTRSLYHYLAELLETLELAVVEYCKAGFLDHAEEDWLTLAAEQLYGVERIEATYASTTVTLTNGGGGLYEFGVGDITFKNSTTGATYHNTSSGTLAAGIGNTLDMDVVADEAGADSAALATEIDTLVTTLPDVTCSNTSAATAIDAESDLDLRERCRDKLGALSPNGPKDAYDYVARNQGLTGTTAVTRTRVFATSTTGSVTVHLAGPSGAVGAGDVTAVEAAILEWATPLCVTPIVVSATNLTLPVTYQLWLYSSVGETTATIETAVADALAAMLQGRPIGGDIIPPSADGYIYHSMIESTIRAVYPGHAFRCVVTSPASDTLLAAGQVAVLGAVTPTVALVVPP